MKSILYFIAFISVVSLYAKDCDACDRTIKGRYVTAGNKTYCNRTCFNKTLPKCKYCKKTLTCKFYRENDGSALCQRCHKKKMPTCMHCSKKVTAWVTTAGNILCKPCSKKTRCDECHLPSKKMRTLRDGRHVCGTCEKVAIYDLQRAIIVYKRARKELKAMTGYQTAKSPRLVMCYRDELMKKLNSTRKLDTTHGMVRGYYHYAERIEQTSIAGKVIKEKKEIKKSIYVLRGMTKQHLILTCIHEHMHDVIRMKFTRLEDVPLWVNEGICQYISAILARDYSMKKELVEIETQADPVYGDGYRYFRKRLGANNWKGLVKWMKTIKLSAIPKSAPKVSLKKKK
ncbi:MAG: hypothetical protein HRT89_23395 [Lentisphaeria bacterium]|nr:hypothetical protein [Lentisphaeria bacterium]